MIKINKKILLLTVFITASFLMLLFTPAKAQIKLETGLPGHSTVPEQTALPSYISYLFIFGLSSIGILALSQMMLGGITYILAAGNVAKVENAKDMIFQALLGVGVLLVSYLFLRTINPDLVNLRNPNLAPTQFQSPPAPSTPPTPIPIGTTCNLGDQYPGFVCVNGSWVKISGNTSRERPVMALIK